MTSISFMVRSSNEIYVEDLRKRNQALEAAYKELERAQEERLRTERLSNLGKFSSLILHDIRNPLSVLKSQFQLMELHIADQIKLKHHIINARAEAVRMERLAGEFLDYTRGDIRLNMSIDTPMNLVERIVSNIKEQFEKSDIIIRVEVENDDPIIIDSERITRVLLNIADNSRKAMGSGGVFSIHITKTEGNLLFELSDSGEGMNEETLQNLFEPFFSMSKQGGTGLGMLIVKNIIEAHGGTISVHSKEKEGTQVTISIPLHA
jgi:signal transduction histidine kinase